MLVAASKTADLMRTDAAGRTGDPVIVQIHGGSRVERLVEAHHQHRRLHVDAEPLDRFDLRPVDRRESDHRDRLDQRACHGACREGRVAAVRRTDRVPAFGKRRDRESGLLAAAHQLERHRRTGRRRRS